VPNPINKVITADITGGDYDDENWWIQSIKIYQTV
jgi:hypothetical protein